MDVLALRVTVVVYRGRRAPARGPLSPFGAHCLALCGIGGHWGTQRVCPRSGGVLRRAESFISWVGRADNGDVARVPHVVVECVAAGLVCRRAASFLALASWLVTLWIIKIIDKCLVCPRPPAPQWFICPQCNYRRPTTFQCARCGLCDYCCRGHEVDVRDRKQPMHSCRTCVSSSSSCFSYMPGRFLAVERQYVFVAVTGIFYLGAGGMVTVMIRRVRKRQAVTE